MSFVNSLVKWMTCCLPTQPNSRPITRAPVGFSDGELAFLEELDSMRSEFPPRDIKAWCLFVNWLKDSPSLLDEVNLSPYSTTAAHALKEREVKELCDALLNNTCVKSIGIGPCQLTVPGLRTFSSLIAESAHLTTLSLTETPLSIDGTQILADTLAKNPALTLLEVRGCGLDAIAARAIARALQTNGTLTSLKLSSNVIGDSGGQAFAQVLAENRTLKTLDLASNLIGDQAATAFAIALTVNSTVTNLRLTLNSFGDIGKQALNRAIEVSEGLWFLPHEEGASATPDLRLLRVDGNKHLACNRQLTLVGLASQVFIGQPVIQAESQATPESKETAKEIKKFVARHCLAQVAHDPDNL